MKFLKNIFIKIIIIFLIIILFCYMIELLGRTSKSYSESIIFIKNNNLILNYLGDIINIHRKLFQDSFVEAGNISGKAMWSFNIKGKKAKGKIFLYLEKELGKWYVRKAILRFDDKEVEIINEYSKNR